MEGRGGGATGTLQYDALVCGKTEPQGAQRTCGSTTIESCCCSLLVLYCSDSSTVRTGTSTGTVGTLTVPVRVLPVYSTEVHGISGHKHIRSKHYSQMTMISVLVLVVTSYSITLSQENEYISSSSSSSSNQTQLHLLQLQQV